jgi:MFS family permease
VNRPRGFLAGVTRLRAFEALRYRGFRLLTWGQVFATMGNWMDEVTRGWLIYELTDSAVQLGLVRGVQAIPLLLLAPVAGSVADRYSRRTQLMIAQAANGLIYAVTALLVFTRLIQPWHLYVTAFLVGGVQVFQQPSRAAMVSDTVPPEYLTNAIGFNSIVFNLSRSIGPAIAGAIIVFSGTAGAFSVQAVFLLLATAWTAMIPAASLGARRTPVRESFAQSILEGWKFSWRSEPVRAGLLCTMLASALIVPFTTLLPVFARDLLAIGANGQGLLLTAMGLGALVSAALIANAGHRLPRGMLMLVSTMGYGLAVVAFAWSPWFSLSLGVMALTGLFHVHSNALVQTVIQSYSPAEFRGRTLALFNMNQVLITLGAVVLGALAGMLGPRLALTTMGTLGFLAMAVMYTAMPRAREIR